MHHQTAGTEHLEYEAIISANLTTLQTESNAPGRELPREHGFSEIWRFVTAAFLIPLLPTLLWWWETRSWIYLRGWINLEYLVLLGIAFLFPSWGTITLLTVEMCIALVEPIAHLTTSRSTMRYFRFAICGTFQSID